MFMLRTLNRSLAARLIAVSAVPSATVMIAGLLLLIHRARGLEQVRPGAGFELIYQGAILGTLAVLSCAALAIVIALRRLFQARINRLQSVMARAASGEFLVRAPIDGEDELADVSKSFNTMLARITDLQIEQLDRSLSMERLEKETALLSALGDANRTREQRLRELTLLFDLTQNIYSTLDLDELLRRICDLIGVRLGFQEFALLLTEDDGSLVVRASYGYPPGAKVNGVRLAPGEGIAGHAAQSGATQLVEDIATDTRYRSYPGEPARVGSFLAIPMRHREKSVGVLAFRRTALRAFGEDDIRLLSAVAQQASLAVVNARLHDATVLQSLTDPLTGVSNRRGMNQRLELELTRGQRFLHDVAVVMIDLDHFKLVNDSRGHAVGDEVLRQVARLLQRNVRKVDEVARYGGEEFLLVLPQLGRAGATDVAEKLRRIIESTPLALAGADPSMVTISAGVATYPEDAGDAQTLLERADAALYIAKHEGRNRVVAFVPPKESRAPKSSAS